MVTVIGSEPNVCPVSRWCLAVTKWGADWTLYPPLMLHLACPRRVRWSGIYTFCCPSWQLIVCLVVFWWLNESMCELLDHCRNNLLYLSHNSWIITLPHFFWLFFLWYQSEKILNKTSIPLNVSSAFGHLTKKMQTQPMEMCSSLQCSLLILWPFKLFSSVYLPYGREDVKGWPTRSPMCLRRKTTTRRIRGREDRPSHPDAANLLPGSHVWIGMPLSGALLLLHEQRHSHGDKQAVAEVTPSLNLLWYGITRFMSCLKLYPLIVSQDFLSSKLSKPLMTVH